MNAKAENKALRDLTGLCDRGKRGLELKKNLDFLCISSAHLQVSCYTVTFCNAFAISGSEYKKTTESVFLDGILQILLARGT